MRQARSVGRFSGLGVQAVRQPGASVAPRPRHSEGFKCGIQVARSNLTALHRTDRSDGSAAGV